MLKGSTALGEIFCYYQEFSWEGVTAKRHEGKICPVCKQVIDSGTVVLLINNHRLFPNAIIHYSCFIKEEPELVVRTLTEDYEQAKKYAYWFK
jgi:hypothetical protein